jgi:hypothetical protein
MHLATRPPNATHFQRFNPDDYDDLIEAADDVRFTLLDVFAADRKESQEETAGMIASVTAESGLTFDELIWQHHCHGWKGGVSVSERQRRAAYKAWQTIRANRKQAAIEEELREAEVA